MEAAQADQDRTAGWKQMSRFRYLPLREATYSLGLPPVLFSMVNGIFSFLMWVKTCCVRMSARLASPLALRLVTTFLKAEAGL